MAPEHFGAWISRLVPLGGSFLCGIGSVFWMRQCHLRVRWLKSWCWLCPVWIFGYHLLTICWRLLYQVGLWWYSKSGLQIIWSDSYTGTSLCERILVWLHWLHHGMESRQGTRICLHCFLILPSHFSRFWPPCHSRVCWYSLSFYWGVRPSFCAIVVGVSGNL